MRGTSIRETVLAIYKSYPYFFKLAPNSYRIDLLKILLFIASIYTQFLQKQNLFLS